MFLHGAKTGGSSTNPVAQLTHSSPSIGRSRLVQVAGDEDEEDDDYTNTKTPQDRQTDQLNSETYISLCPRALISIIS